jgi:ADP-heptose:LPS heptosyltransferase
LLVLRPGALGDTLLAVPALRALRRAFAPITLAAHPGAARLLVTFGEVEHGIAFDDPSLAYLFRGDQMPVEPIVAWMTGSTGLTNAELVAPSRPAGVEHAAHYLLRTLEPLGIDLAFDDQPLRVTPIDVDEVLVHPGSGSVVKNWPANKFGAVIRALGTPVRLVVGEADSAVAAEIESLLGRTLPRLERPPLEELAARLAGCRAYLGNDSGVSHLAGLCGAHTVVMFGPTRPEIWHPLGPDVHVLPFETHPHDVASLLAS